MCMLIVLRHMNQDPSFWMDRSSLKAVGVCTGSIAAIAVSVSLSETHLLKIAPEFVLLSLRMGIAASRRSLALEMAPGDWAVTFSATSVEKLEEMLEDFHRSKVSYSAHRE